MLIQYHCHTGTHYNFRLLSNSLFGLSGTCLNPPFTRLHFAYSNSYVSMKRNEMKSANLWHTHRYKSTTAHIEIEMQIYRYFVDELDRICNQIGVYYIYPFYMRTRALICNLSYYICIHIIQYVLLMIAMRK